MDFMIIGMTILIFGSVIFYFYTINSKESAKDALHKELMGAAGPDALVVVKSPQQFGPPQGIAINSTRIFLASKNKISDLPHASVIEVKTNVSRSLDIDFNMKRAIKSAILRLTIDDLKHPWFEIDMMDCSTVMGSMAFDEANKWFDRLNVIIHRNTTGINPPA